MSTLATEAIEAAEQPSVVRAVMVAPTGADELHVKHVYLFTLALPGQGVQLDPDAVVQLLGSRRLQLHRLHDSEGLLTAVDSSGPSWRCCCSGPHRGPGLVLRLAGNGDVAGGTHLTLGQAAAMLVLDEADNEEAHHGCQAA